MRRGGIGRFLPLVIAGSMPLAALAQAPTPQGDPAAIVDRFLRTLRGGHHDRLGVLITDRVATGDGESLRRDQIILLHRGYTDAMFGPLRSYACEPPIAAATICMLRFRSRHLRQRYTVEAGLISGIEILPVDDR
ncbi:MAG TPA: hypothetical protein VMS43_14500 [Allosphingosinicella sp.]|nr:hypothetical protein [Allosphingosinicella sp.]